MNARFDQLEKCSAEPAEQWVYEMLLATLRESLDEHQVTSLTAEGGVWGEEQAVVAGPQFTTPIGSASSICGP